MNIILIGFKSAGKTTLGKTLADVLNKPFFDVDQMIAAQYSHHHSETFSVKDIFLKVGEPVFRELESQAIKSVVQYDDAVIAVGGGSLGDQTNIEILSQVGCFLYLKTAPDCLKKRIQSENKIPFENFDDVYHQRIKVYERLANFVVDTGLNDIEACIKHITRWRDEQ